MLIVIATLPGKPEKRTEIAGVLASAAATSRGDAGCLSYAFHVDVEDPDRWVSVETWSDQASLDAHFATPHLAELFRVAPELLSGDPVIQTYESDGPKS